jgi:hypothetical protein
MSTWYVFSLDTCPHAMSTLSKARWFKGLDKRTCPFHLSNVSISMIVGAFSNQRLDNAHLSKPQMCFRRSSDISRTELLQDIILPRAARRGCLSGRIDAVHDNTEFARDASSVFALASRLRARRAAIRRWLFSPNRTGSRRSRSGYRGHVHMLRHARGYKLANDRHGTRAIQAYQGHRNIQKRLHRLSASTI